MARFESRNVSEADVAAPREKIWASVSSPACLGRLTPLIDTIVADGDLWRWSLKSISALGMQTKLSFTERMTFEEGRSIIFEHHPPDGTVERAGARGTYTLADLDDGGTHLSVDITLHVDLPLPAISRRAVERVMASTMARTGKMFAANLDAHLGIGPAPAPSTAAAGS
jgi:carbon monoxide dehydrogenase subunit G